MWNQEGIPLLWRGQGLWLSVEFGQKSVVWMGQDLWLSAEFGQKSAVWNGQGLWLSETHFLRADNKGGFQHYSWFSMFFFDFPFFKSSYFAFNLDPFDEFRCIFVFLNIFFKAKLHWNETKWKMRFSCSQE